METISLKALSLKVLHGNTHGNKMETLTFLDGNIEAKKEGGMFPCFHNAGVSLHKMSLSEFEKAGLIVKVFSEVLNEMIYFVSSDAVITHNPLDAVSYTAQELTAMIDMIPEEVRAAHLAKTIFHRARVIKHTVSHGQL